jgi:S1-C subfamily serine protease
MNICLLTPKRVFVAVAAAVAICGPGEAVFAGPPSLADVIDSVQPKIVKIYGAGGFRRLEAYQSGFLISSKGHVLTTWSYVLDTDYIVVVLNDGRKFQAELLGADPRLEIAVLKLDEVDDTPFFDLAEAVPLRNGSRVLAFSNMYSVATGNEPASVVHGLVSAKTTLDARSGMFETPYRGPVYVLDAMTNNPGAGGGALTDHKGRLAGLLGKELKNGLNNTWLNFSIPISEIEKSIEDIRAGRFQASTSDPGAEPAPDPLTLDVLGLVMIPDVLPRTPPFVDRILPDTPAQRVGLRPDDLILFLDNRMIQSFKDLSRELSLIDRATRVRITVMRGRELKEFELGATP